MGFKTTIQHVLYLLACVTDILGGNEKVWYRLRPFDPGLCVDVDGQTGGGKLRIYLKRRFVITPHMVRGNVFLK